MHNSYDVIQVDNYVIFNTLQNFHFRENFIFLSSLTKNMFNLMLEKIKTNIISNIKYLNINWYIVKNNTFFPNQRLILNKTFQNCY